MDKSLLPFSLSLVFLLLALMNTCAAKDNTTVTPTQYITDPQTLTSAGEIFKLGFFSPANSSNRYVGIWYNKIPGPTIVWVANRDNPLTNFSGVLKIAEDGNLVVLDGGEIVLWSTNVTYIVSNNSVAELLDSGNLVLRQVSNGKILWKSFDFPTDTLLPTMELGATKRTGKKIQLTSWKNESDPSIGTLTAAVDTFDWDIPQLVISNGSHRLWRGDNLVTLSRLFVGATPNTSTLGGFWSSRGFSEENLNIGFDYADNSSFARFVLDHRGEFFEEIWRDGVHKWLRVSSIYNNECDFYGKCGPYGICNEFDSPICSCLEGFRPKFENEWSKGNWSGGCVRKMELQCERNRSSTGTTSYEGAKADGFLKLNGMKMPDFGSSLVGPSNIVECENECLKNCSCVAYMYGYIFRGCVIWAKSLVDMHNFTSYGGVQLHIRGAYRQENQEKKNSKVVIISTTVVIGAFTIIVCAYFCWRWTAKQRENPKEDMEMPVNMDNFYKESSDLNIFKFEKVAIATNNFCEANKLGEGGFGPVYKGKFLDEGQEIAVKRLSKGSLQGFEEFKNEVLVILKLQHKNLVRLLGCCIDEEEKMLIYEYMPNRSLDVFIFDPTKRALLDWSKRFQIIKGICRGILYLHRDSRLRVIHRDLKASNVLLDEELNPKISDFGMARIFGGNELQANTGRVVGTYGYMSPEYAMEGLFSEKSDVFSFGVLLLEIVSGKRNASFYNQKPPLSLLRYAWELWNDNNAQLLIDPTLLAEPIYEVEILTCIHVGLLCVQEFAKDRPTMSTTLSMLTSDQASFPAPKQPAFTDKRITSDSNPSQKNQKACSINNLTITDVQGR